MIKKTIYWESMLYRLTIHGHSPGSAFWPPTILSWSWGPFFRPQWKWYPSSSLSTYDCVVVVVVVLGGLLNGGDVVVKLYCGCCCCGGHGGITGGLIGGLAGVVDGGWVGAGGTVRSGGWVGSGGGQFGGITIGGGGLTSSLWLSCTPKTLGWSQHTPNI